MSVPHLLHVFSTFVPAGPEMRTVRLIEGLGDGWQHSILAVDGRTTAAEHLPVREGIRVLEAPPKSGSLRGVLRLRALIGELRPDLLLTYNWGAFDAVIAARSRGFAHVVHHEDGFISDEAHSFKRRRILARRLLLPGVKRVVVPSQRLYEIATTRWKLDEQRVLCIPNGVRVERFDPADGNPKLRTELGIPADALVVGTVGHLRGEKNPRRLVEAASSLCTGGAADERLHLLFVGEGPERAPLEDLAARSPLAGRVHLVGHQDDPRSCYRAMDVFCLPSDTEQMPVALLEAMASELPAASTDVGDVRHILPAEQAAFVVEPASLADALGQLLANGELRRALGAQNRARIEQQFTFQGMLDAYAGVYAEALPAP